MAVKKQIFKIDGMHCTSCSLLIDGDLEDTKGVMSAFTNYARGETQVEFDENMVSVDEIVKIIQNTGYQVKVGGNSYSNSFKPQ